jgi:uncharacterized membrane protein
MKELIDINRYLHDFTSALWVSGSILLWLLLREARPSDVGVEARRMLGRLGRLVMRITIPAFVLSLATGTVRAATFSKYEHIGEITQATITILVVKHIAFTALVAWGVWLHWKVKTGLRPNH